MAVVPFSVARFTPADLVEFYRIVLPDCARGFWSGIVRETGADGDCLVLSAVPGEPAFTLKRDKAGIYRLYRHGAEGKNCVASAGSVPECLAGWLPRRGAGGRRFRFSIPGADELPGTG